MTLRRNHDSVESWRQKLASLESLARRAQCHAPRAPCAHLTGEVLLNLSGTVPGGVYSQPLTSRPRALIWAEMLPRPRYELPG
jgi:hypothetical protein